MFLLFLAREFLKLFQSFKCCLLYANEIVGSWGLLDTLQRKPGYWRTNQTKGWNFSAFPHTALE